MTLHATLRTIIMKLPIVTRMLLGIVVFSVGGCGRTERDVAMQEEKAITVEEERPIAEGIVEEGVECPLLRTEDGALYSMSGALVAGLRPGERVRIFGERMDLSRCMQGSPVRVRRVVRLGAP